MDQSERPRFFEGQYLGAEDLSAGFDYGRVQTARHGLGAHTWGIAVGLDLVERTLPSGDIDVSIMPGVAWDGYARPVVVLAPARLSADKFANFQAVTPPDGLLVKIWLRYDETTMHGPAPGFENCRTDDQGSRSVESFAIEVGEPPGGQHGALTIASRSVDAANARAAFNPNAPKVYDESIPYQTFPEGKLSHWLIPIGYVRWLKLAGQPGRLIARNETGTPPDSDLIRGFRRYLGVVAETINAADGVIRIRDRWTDPDPAKTFFKTPQATVDPKKPPVNDLVWIEGHLRVMGDVRISGGKVEWRDQTGADNGVPLAIRRVESNKQGGKDLQVVIGAESNPAGKHAFAIGPGKLDPATGALSDVDRKLVVRDDGNVGIATETPQASLEVNGDIALDQVAKGAARPLPAGATMMWSDGQFLRINQNRDYTQPIFAVHTPGLFAPVSLNVGGFGKWDDPGWGSALFQNRVGIGITKPAASLDVAGRILRNSQDFSVAGTVVHKGVVSAPPGTTIGDWNIFVSPNSMGLEEPNSEFDNAMLMLKCSAAVTPGSDTSWTITAQYKFKFANAPERANGEWRDGTANYILVPR